MKLLLLSVALMCAAVVNGDSVTLRPVADATIFTDSAGAIPASSTRAAGKVRWLQSHHTLVSLTLIILSFFRSLCLMNARACAHAHNTLQ